MVYLLRLTVGDRSVVIVWIEGRHPSIFTFGSAYDGLLFERSVGPRGGAGAFRYPRAPGEAACAIPRCANLHWRTLT